MVDADGLMAQIVELTQAHWDEHHAPYLLSNLGPALTSSGIDYSNIIKPFRLRQFISTWMAGKVKIVTHPTQPTRIGLIPTAENYEFSLVDEPQNRSAADKVRGRTRLDPLIWDAFTKPVTPGMLRYVDVSSIPVAVKELEKAVSAPGHIPISSEYITENYDRSAVMTREVWSKFEAWLSENGLAKSTFISDSSSSASQTGAAVVKFLEALNVLSNEDLDQIQIPTRIIVRLIRDK